MKGFSTIKKIGLALLVLWLADSALNIYEPKQPSTAKQPLQISWVPWSL